MIWARAAVTMSSVAIATKLLPYAWWRPLPLDALAASHRQSNSSRSIAELLLAVDRASRVVPRGHNCLVRAITARRLLATHGFPSSLRFGVAKTPAGKLEGHAWLLCDGRIVVGGGVDRCMPMTGPSLGGGGRANYPD